MLAGPVAAEIVGEVAKGLANLTALKSLKLHCWGLCLDHAGLDTAGMRAFCQHLPHMRALTLPSITADICSEVYIVLVAEGLKVLAESLEAMPQLKPLVLDRCEVEGAAAQRAITGALEACFGPAWADTLYFKMCVSLQQVFASGFRKCSCKGMYSARVSIVARVGMGFEIS